MAVSTSLLTILPQRAARLAALAALGLVFCFESYAFSQRLRPAATASLPRTQPYRVTRWTTEEGLPQNSVTSIVQTRDGYLWLGTFGGLARFDGVRFTIFNTANTPQLKSNRITALLEDRAGALWIGTESGELVRYSNGAFAAWPGVGGTILSFYQERTGVLWGLRMGARPLRFAPEQPERAAVVSEAQGLNGERMYSLCEDRAGQLWATTRQGVVVWRDGAFRTEHGIAGLPQRGLPRVAPHPDGSLWVVEEKGLGRIVNQRFALLVETADVMGVPPPPLLETRRGESWFGYREDRLWRGAGEGNFSEFHWQEAQPYLLRVMIEDREGNLWLGSQGGGLIRLRPHRVRTLTQADGLPGNEILALSEDAQGNAWVVTPAGLIRLAGGAGAGTPPIITWTKAELELLAVLQSVTFQRDQTGILWLGGNGHLAQVRNGQLALQELKGVTGVIHAVLTDRNGETWLGLNNATLVRLRGGAVRQLFTRADGLVTGEIGVLREDRSGSLWIGARQGLSQFKDGRFTNYTTASGLSNGHVRDLYEDQDGALWIGTYGGGLNRLKAGRITQVTTKQGLFDDVVSRILVDDQDRFWLLGNRGIFYVSRQQLNEVADGRSRAVTCGSYGVADGMLSSEGNGLYQPAGWRMRDGRLWFPTLKGIAIVDPRVADTPPAPVVIEQVRLNNEAVDFRYGVEVAPGRENLEIQFTGLSLGKPEQVRFRYRLAGLETEWVEADTRRAAYYPHLPPGAYTFEVLAANPDGVWSATSTRLKLTVHAPFYRRWWFIALVLTGGVGLALLGFKLRLRQLERARAAQEEFSRRLLDSQEQERSRIAAELHDSLGQSLLIIKNRAYTARQDIADPQAIKEQLDEISDSAALAIEEVREIAYDLRPYQLERFGLTKTLRGICQHAEQSSGIVFEAELDPLDGLFAHAAEVNLYRIVQEGVNNIIKHSQATTAQLQIRRNGSTVHLTLRDNGCGFDLASKSETAKPGGFGLIGLAERVRMLGGSYVVESEPRAGVTLHVFLPLTETS